MRPKTFELSAAARLDVLQIWNWLAEHSSLDVADKIATDLEQGMQHLADSPGLGHRRSDLTRRPVRFYLIHSWLIIYRPERAPLHVLRILHASRNIKRILSEESDNE